MSSTASHATRADTVLVSCGSAAARSHARRDDARSQRVVKALAVDAALALLAGEGFVAAGGDVAARGGTIVGLPGGGSARLVRGGVATSGTTRRRWLRGDGLQHHLIDPRTGWPARTRWTEVTVVAGSCLSADVAAKAAFPPE